MFDEFDNWKESLGYDHVLYLMMAEHEVLLELLDNLEDVNSNIQKFVSYDEAKKDIEALSNIINIIISAEAHHQREEKVLFPELIKRGVVGPTKVMTWEHHELREYKHELKTLAVKINAENFINVKKEINFIIQQFIPELREHILKENNVLYPISLDFIQDNEVWKQIKEKCDQIGYCPFTPVSLVNSNLSE